MTFKEIENKLSNIEKLRERFCKDRNLPVKIFISPYFESRLKLVVDENGFSDEYVRYEKFINMVYNRFGNAEEYFAYYNKIKDDAINFIKATDGYNKFNQEDMNKFRIQNIGFPAKDIYKATNNGKRFISIDMGKANFSALKRYDSSIVGNTNSYEEFISMFVADIEHLKASKYIRQVIFGNCNPGRTTTYEKYLMDTVLTKILEVVKKDDVVFFATDEIVIDVSMYEQSDLDNLYKLIIKETSKFSFPLKVSMFNLSKLNGVDGYVKHNIDGTREIKGVNSVDYPFVARALLGQDVCEDDAVFVSDGRLAKLLDVPIVSLSEEL